MTPTPTYQANLALPMHDIEAFCRRHHIRKLSLFGSVLRADFHAESDVDFLVEFEAGQSIGYFDLARMEIELTEMVGRKVDLRTPEELSRYFRQRVLDAAETLSVYR